MAGKSLENSDVTNGAVVPGRSRRGGAKQPHQKYFNDDKSEFDEVC